MLRICFFSTNILSSVGYVLEVGQWGTAAKIQVGDGFNVVVRKRGGSQSCDLQERRVPLTAR